MNVLLKLLNLHLSLQDLFLMSEICDGGGSSETLLKTATLSV